VTNQRPKISKFSPQSKYSSHSRWSFSYKFIHLDGKFSSLLACAMLACADVTGCQWLIRL